MIEHRRPRWRASCWIVLKSQWPGYEFSSRDWVCKECIYQVPWSWLGVFRTGWVNSNQRCCSWVTVGLEDGSLLLTLWMLSDNDKVCVHTLLFNWLFCFCFVFLFVFVLFFVCFCFVFYFVCLFVCLFETGFLCIALAVLELTM
jgi:cellulose synthase/poly-beta-1,6-N-acetylglucosamine synthase-like glycosyltransferase